PIAMHFELAALEYGDAGGRQLAHALEDRVGRRDHVQHEEVVDALAAHGCADAWHVRDLLGGGAKREHVAGLRVGQTFDAHAVDGQQHALYVRIHQDQCERPEQIFEEAPAMRDISGMDSSGVGGAAIASPPAWLPLQGDADATGFVSLERAYE